MQRKPIAGWALLAAAAVLALTVAGCARVMGRNGQMHTMQPTGVAPAAAGTVNTEITENNNTRFDVEVKFLAPAQALDENANTYVVWLRPLEEDRPPMNVGELRVDQNREGSLEGITSLRQFEVTVTPERSGAVQSPSGKPVLSTNVYVPQ